MSARSVLRRLTPPVVWDAAHEARVRLTARGRQRGVDFYDRSHDEIEHFHAPYSQSPYYFLWTVIADRIRESKSVLEVACGPGQLAALLRDQGLEGYLGFDFSPRRLAAARVACPEFRFEVADAFHTDLFMTFDYDTVVATEFFEHVDDDLGVIARIKPGTRVIGTVPNFRSAGHVRFFRSADEVFGRYGARLNDLRVSQYPAVKPQVIFYLFDGMVPSE